MDFFEEHHNTLDEDFCKHIIEKFEKDSGVFPGVTGAGFDTKIKDSTDLCFYTDPNWKEEDSIFYESLKKYTTPYIEKYYDGRITDSNVKTYDTGYQIQRTTPEQTGYTWHHDSISQYLSHDYIPGPKTIYTNCRALPAGSYAAVSATRCTAPLTPVT